LEISEGVGMLRSKDAKLRLKMLAGPVLRPAGISPAVMLIGPLGNARQGSRSD
jgi:hypothetical protein